MTTRDALDEAMHRETVDEAMSTLLEREVWLADVDTMTHAIHTVYCGIMADHQQPNEKDRDQARQLIAAIGAVDRDRSRGREGLTALGLPEPEPGPSAQSRLRPPASAGWRASGRHRRARGSGAVRWPGPIRCAGTASDRRRS